MTEIMKMSLFELIFWIIFILIFVYLLVRVIMFGATKSFFQARLSSYSEYEKKRQEKEKMNHGPKA